MHTADAVATKLDSFVASDRRCELGLRPQMALTMCIQHCSSTNSDKTVGKRKGLLEAKRKYTKYTVCDLCPSSLLNLVCFALTEL